MAKQTLTALQSADLSAHTKTTYPALYAAALARQQAAK